MSSVAGEGVGGLLGHKVCYSRLKFGFGTLPLPFCSLVLFFQRLVLLSVHAGAGPFDQCDRWKRNLGAPNLSRRTQGLSEQVRRRAAPTVQSGLIFSLSVFSFLFPSNFTY